VRVGHTPIGQAPIEHWMDVIAGEVSTGPGQPKSEVPVPPEYAACIAYKRKYPVAVSGGWAGTSRFHIRRECAFEFQKEKLKALYFLISSRWVEGAASELGVRTSAGELRRQVASLVARFPNRATARHFLVGTRGTEADLSMRLETVALTSAIQQKLEAQSRQKGLTRPERQRALEEFGDRFKSTWRSRTSCRPGYVVPICKQHYVPPKIATTLAPPDVPLTKMTAK
jgi:hypothetical protein